MMLLLFIALWRVGSYLRDMQRDNRAHSDRLCKILSQTKAPE